MIDKFGHLQANLCFIAALVLGAILTMLVKSDLRRQNAHVDIDSDHPHTPAILRHNSISCLT